MPTEYESSRSDHLLDLLVDQLRECAIVTADLNGRFSSWHPGVLTLFGYRAEEFIGMHAAMLFPDPERLAGEADREFEAAAATGKAAATRWLVAKTGTRRLVDGVTLALRNGTGTLVGFGKVMLDVTEGRATLERLRTPTGTLDQSALEMQGELEAVNAQLERLTLELERSNQELEEFARIASHDLSAPITSTRWLVDLLTAKHGKNLNDDGRKILQQIATGLQRMSELVEAVLQHAHVGTSSIVSTEGTDAEAALAAAMENVGRDIEISNAKITHGALPTVQIAMQALTHLFQNLLSNAIKYRKPDTAPAITISAELAGDEWLFSLTDNGMGIEPEWLERIFRPMQRRHGPEIAGSGIGLATCRKIVIRAGGRIWAESEVDRGSTFRFTVPGKRGGG